MLCEAPTFMEWSTMVVPTYPEGGSQALQVCQHHHQVLRVGDFVGKAVKSCKVREYLRFIELWTSRFLRSISR